MKKYYDEMKMYKLLKYGVTAMVLAIVYWKIKFIKLMITILLNPKLIYEEFNSGRTGLEPSVIELFFYWFGTITLYVFLVLIIGLLIIAIYTVVKITIAYILDKLSIFEEIKDKHNAIVVSKRITKHDTTTIVGTVPIHSKHTNYYIELKIGDKNTITKEIEVDEEDWDELSENENINVILSGYRIARTKEVIDYTIELDI